MMEDFRRYVEQRKRTNISEAFSHDDTRTELQSTTYRPELDTVIIF